MKKIIYPILALAMLAVSSCGDSFYDFEPKGSLGASSFWKSEEDAIAAANALYANQTHPGSYGQMYTRGYFWYICASDDMIVGRDKAQSIDMKNFENNGSESYTRDLWRVRYQNIRRANEILANVPAMDIGQKVKDRVMGEAYFMSGVMYFELAYRFGDEKMGVPIINVENMDQPNVERPASVVENYKDIEERLKMAAQLLPKFSEYGPEDYGRGHKHAANAYLAKAYAFHAKYDASMWAECAKAADKVIAEPTHDLMDEYTDVFKVKNNWSKEYLWSVVGYIDQPNSGSGLPIVMLENKGWGKYNGWGYFHPTLDLYEEYEAGDKRKKATLMEFGDEFQYFGETRRYYSTNSRTGLQFRKYMDPFEEPLNVNVGSFCTNLNMPLMRYAEVLLLKSEALIMQGQNGDAPLNQIRQRAGLQPISGATMADLKHERRCELAGEWSDRHADLIRWGDAKDVYHKPLYGRRHADKTDPDSGYEVVEVWKARTNFDPATHHIWPIPPHEVEASGGVLKQNAGW
ncbi:membrane protein (plasmid) [Fulvitalea axinellae]|uniref:Membrane protein n=1 Tax=Fulvitalea axinellae TaxID=1182444 RepID=A0AAU9CT95_9BACT|nr:membrane protein [Fulvitalea axinellae]